MEIIRPTEDDWRAVSTNHAARHPQKAVVEVPDGTGTARLPLILGNPSGSKIDAKETGVWATFMRAALHVEKDPPTLAADLAADCVLWPSPPVWSQWVERWPGLPKSVADGVATKIGCIVGESTTPPPEPVAEQLAARPRAIWRTLVTLDGVYVVVLEPPSAPVWRVFVDALKDPAKDTGVIARELVQACVVAGFERVKDEHRPWDADAAMDRTPGIISGLCDKIAYLAGAAAEVRMGEW